MYPSHTRRERKAGAEYQPQVAPPAESSYPPYSNSSHGYQPSQPDYSQQYDQQQTYGNDSYEEQSYEDQQYEDDTYQEQQYEDELYQEQQDGRYDYSNQGPPMPPPNAYQYSAQPTHHEISAPQNSYGNGQIASKSGGATYAKWTPPASKWTPPAALPSNSGHGSYDSNGYDGQQGQYDQDQYEDDAVEQEQETYDDQNYDDSYAEQQPQPVVDYSQMHQHYQPTKAAPRAAQGPFPGQPGYKWQPPAVMQAYLQHATTDYVEPSPAPVKAAPSGHGHSSYQSTHEMNSSMHSTASHSSRGSASKHIPADIPGYAAAQEMNTSTHSRSSRSSDHQQTHQAPVVEESEYHGAAEHHAPFPGQSGKSWKATAQASRAARASDTNGSSVIRNVPGPARASESNITRPPRAEAHASHHHVSFGSTVAEREGECQSICNAIRSVNYVMRVLSQSSIY
jgi:hypothetical protein